MTEPIYMIDERATKRAARLQLALDSLKAKGKTRTKRYKELNSELDRLRSGNRQKRPVGASIGVPRT